MSASHNYRPGSWEPRTPGAPIEVEEITPAILVTMAALVLILVAYAIGFALGVLP